MEEIIFTRKELYDTLWKEPMSVLIKKYQTNYTELKNICKKMQILDIPLQSVPPIPAQSVPLQLLFFAKIPAQSVPLLQVIFKVFSGR